MDIKTKTVNSGKIIELKGIDIRRGVNSVKIIKISQKPTWWEWGRTCVTSRWAPRWCCTAGCSCRPRFWSTSPQLQSRGHTFTLMQRLKKGNTVLDLKLFGTFGAVVPLNFTNSKLNVALLKPISFLILSLSAV